MIVWIDFRNTSSDLINYKQLLFTIAKLDTNNTYYIYTNNPLEISFKNVIIKKVSSDSAFIKETKKDNIDLMVFINKKTPFFYKWKNIVVVEDLIDLAYPKVVNNWSLNKWKNMFMLKHKLKKADKILCFDKNTKVMLNELLNIEENKIKKIQLFFDNKSTDIVNKIDVETDVKIKYSIANDYIVYPWKIWNERNILRFLEVYKELTQLKKLDLVLLWEEVSNDIETREKIMRLWIKSSVHFINEEEVYDLIYKQSKLVVLPSLYEVFPICLLTAIHNDATIIASDIPNISEIFVDKIYYFSPKSNKDMLQNIVSCMVAWKKEIDYSKIIDTYTVETTANAFINTISTI